MPCCGKKFNFTRKKMELTCLLKKLKDVVVSLNVEIMFLYSFIILTVFDTVGSEIDNKYLLK